jgi:hypothetical protein
MDGSSTMASSEVGEKNQERSGTSPGWARLIFLAGLVVLGAFVPFALASHRAASPDRDLAEQAGPAKPPARADSNRGTAEHTEHKAMAAGAMAAGSRSIVPGDIEEEWGVRLTRLTIIAAGGLVDLRYEVTDRAKASKVLGPEQPAYLLDEASGKAVSTAQFPRLGNLRPQSKVLEEDRAYFMEFSNPGGLFEAGDHVTLAIGSHRLEHAVVR